MAFKGQIPWNKGLTKKDDERVLKYSISKSNKLSPSTKLRHENKRKKVYGEYYSMINDGEWFIKCTECDENDIKYIRFNKFFQREQDRLNGLDVKCGSCLCKNRIYTEERKINSSIAAKNRYAKMTQDEKYAQIAKCRDSINNPEIESIRRNKISISHKQRYLKMSIVDRNDLNVKIINGQNNKPLQEQIEWRRKVSVKRKEEMQRLGTNDVFKPSYNVNTIPYSIDILNVKYETKFIHAESEKGEFRIYDKLLQKSYFADAYSEELNLWIEFDEGGKYDGEFLKEEHMKREQRIRKLLKCNILRIDFNKKYYENLKEI